MINRNADIYNADKIYINTKYSLYTNILQNCSSQFNSNDQIYQFILISWAVPRDDVIESTRFLMRPPVIIPPWCHQTLFGCKYTPSGIMVTKQWKFNII